MPLATSSFFGDPQGFHQYLLDRLHTLSHAE